MTFPPHVPHNQRVKPRSSAKHEAVLDRCLFELDGAAFAAFQAMLDAPAEPSEEMRRTLNTPPPWSE